MDMLIWMDNDFIFLKIKYFYIVFEYFNQKVPHSRYCGGQQTLSSSPEVQPTKPNIFTSDFEPML